MLTRAHATLRHWLTCESMSLRHRALLVIVITMILLGAGGLGGSHFITLRSFEQLENQQLVRDVERARLALAEEVGKLSAWAVDWACWDQIYAHLKEPGKAPLPSDLSNEMMSYNHLNILFYLDRTFQVVYASAYDTEKGTTVPVPDEVKGLLTSTSPLLRSSPSLGGVSGLVMQPQGPLMLASHPVLDSQAHGPAQGWLVVGRYLTPSMAAQLAARTRLDLVLQSARTPLELPGGGIARLPSEQSLTEIQVVNKQFMVGVGLWNDLFGKPGLMLAVRSQRETFRKGHETVTFFGGTLLVCTLLGAFFAMRFLSRLVVDPVAGIIRQVEKIEQEQDLASRVELPVEGELGRLTGAINGMLASLERLDVQEKAYLQQLQEEKARSERLLNNVLPAPVAARLKDSPQTIAESYPEVTVIFADIVGFTRFSAQKSPSELVDILNRLFSVFDQLCEKHGLEKIKTIGDAYLAVAGLPVPRADHAEAAADLALDMQQAIRQFNLEHQQSLSIRIGAHTGPVVAGVIGMKKFSYDLWGDTVNIASRMESHGLEGCIQVTPELYQRLKPRYRLDKRGEIEIKGRGRMTTYILYDRRAKEPLPIRVPGTFEGTPLIHWARLENPANLSHDATA